MRQASLDDVPSAQDVGLIELFPRPHHAGNAADMEHRIDSATRGDHRLAIAQISPDRFDAQSIQRRAVLAADRPHAIAVRDKLFDDVQPQKAAAAGDQCVHAIPCATRQPIGFRATRQRSAPAEQSLSVFLTPSGARG